ncbi:hypothetical protein M501DRAFT_993664 [Patellaria atrata CBS 101060]|uniref:Uncharacterized protein n=1 Tax=Patellaria atrata CBS 101060 TaxID=1346257 RepID=A0A9P4SID6_9PEZI|nr:hypothetical protein M501DRAFT_993664 [Patellaria atrata CBS 101060]
MWAFCEFLCSYSPIRSILYLCIPIASFEFVLMLAWIDKSKEDEVKHLAFGDKRRELAKMWRVSSQSPRNI